MHQHFKKGVKVFVKLKNGETFTAKFHERVRKKFRFLDREPIRIDKIRFISINKPQIIHDRV